MTTTKRTPKLKAYQATDSAESTDQAKHRDGRDARQVSVATLATSQVHAAAAMGMSIGDLRSMGGETWNDEAVAALAAHEPGTGLVRSLDPGGTVREQTGWIVRPEADRIAQRHAGHVESARQAKIRQAEREAEWEAEAERKAQTCRRSEELVAEAARALEQLGYRPDTVKVTDSGAVAMPSEVFADLLRRASEQAEMESMGL